MAAIVSSVAENGKDLLKIYEIHEETFPPLLFSILFLAIGLLALVS